LQNQSPQSVRAGNGAVAALEEDAMLRRVATLAVAGLVMPVLVPAAELPVTDHGSVSVVSTPPSVSTLVPAASPAPSLRLVWIDPAGVVLGTEAVVEPEVAKLLREMGLKTSWRRGAAQELAKPGELRVIFLNRAAPREHGAPVLGATPSSFQGGAPFVWVHVPSVRAATGLDPRGGPLESMGSMRRVGIALARVIAHEVVHAVVPSLPHSGGLMSPRLDRHMLTAASITLDPQLGVAVRSALAGAAPVSRDVPEILAAESRSFRESYR
jgi:hypothetical protein